MPRPEFDPTTMRNAATLAPLLAQHMDGWRAKPRSADESPSERNHAYLVRDDGASLSIWTGRYRNETRVEITGCGPANNRKVYIGDIVPKGTKLAITVDATRSPEKIAAEISRRLLPVYLPAYADCVRRVQAKESGEAGALALADELRKLAGSSWKPSLRGNNAGSVDTYVPRGMMRVTTHADDRTVSFEIAGSPDFARAICAILAKHADEDQ